MNRRSKRASSDNAFNRVATEPLKYPAIIMEPALVSSLILSPFLQSLELLLPSPQHSSVLLRSYLRTTWSERLDGTVWEAQHSWMHADNVDIINCFRVCFSSKYIGQHKVVSSRMVSSGMLRRVAIVSTDVSVELGASFIRVTRIGELETTLAHRFLLPWWRRR
jgi:hypothetical protein